MPRAKLISILAAGVVLAAQSAYSANFKVTTALARNHDQVVTYFNLFHDPVNKAKNGISLRYLGGPEVTPNTKQGPALKRGLIDLVFSPASYYAGLVPEGKLAAISNRGHRELRANGAYDAMQEAWAKGLNARILAWPFWEGTTFHVYLKEKPKISKKTGIDLTGEKIRAASLYIPFLKAMGAVPISISPGDVYTSLQRGVVSGLAWPEGAVTKYGWQEYIRWRVEPGFWRSSTMLIMNLEKYKALSKKDRDTLEAASLKFEDDSGPFQRKVIDIDNAKMFKTVQRLKLDREHARAYLKTVNGATWDDARKQKLTVPYAKIRKLLLEE